MTSLYAPSADDVKQRLRPFGIFFEKSLKDLIKGIRSNNGTPEKLQQFLAQALSECREEANSPDMNIKTNAILKLTYLEMYGFDMSWANFHILEVMSSSKLQQKRVGYLAASQSFHKDSDVLMLATNLMKKDLKFGGNYDVVKVGIALSGLSTIVTPALAADICDDLFSMLNSPKPYIRKKAVTALFKVFLQYPEALRDNFDKFAAKLEDDDTSVLSAMVSVICELSKQNPKPFIQLSPILYEILVTISNNWIIIRLLKLFTNLSKIEPKLRPKLLPKILELMDSTMATSVLYESINCIVKGNMLDGQEYDTAICCLDRLHNFCDSSDPNLRYISCVLFYKIGKINVAFISQFDKLVLRLLNDVDISTRSKALELVEGIVNEDNLQSIVLTLLKQLTEEGKAVMKIGASRFESTKEISIVITESYKTKMMNTIIHICSMDDYSNLSDFNWYNSVLLDIAMLCQELSEPRLEQKIGEQFRNIMVKVPSMREDTMSTIIKLLSTDSIYTQIPGVLKELIWSLGEFSSLIDNGDDLIESIIAKDHYYAPSVQQIVIIALLKIFSHWSNNHEHTDRARLKGIMRSLLRYLERLSCSKYFEVQERAIESMELLKLSSEALNDDPDGLPLLISDVIPSLFNYYELKPISSGAQQQMQRNVTVDCETPFLTAEELEQILEQDGNTSVHSEGSMASDISDIEPSEEIAYSSSDENQPTKDWALSKEEKEELERRKKEERQSNPFYLAEEEVQARTNNDLLDFEENAHDEQSANVIRLNRTANVTGPDEFDKSQTKSKKKKRSTKRVEILPDEVIQASNGDATIPGSDMKPSRSSPSISSLTSSNKKINLRTQNKLENFDFSKPKASSVLLGNAAEASGSQDEQVELEKLRQKFANQALVGPTDGNSDEEVVVIKKKKKNSSKKKRKESSKTNSTPANDEPDILEQ
ncbi:hypothetical protein HG536_0A01430 [Torulaspora globosa]|uniref:AP-3 complex subunit delta n=1 Tax=Torulaspora globosa TaxID=48254 RepID=A0A7G3Z9Z0_9SACH|nr:uncharacterized protein HG536_0A01430 [Torulaspora globosa]QLL30326.1 hypothetical protein HG536_0A01430 [Torulaspora globosa]